MVGQIQHARWLGLNHCLCFWKKCWAIEPTLMMERVSAYDWIITISAFCSTAKHSPEAVHSSRAVCVWGWLEETQRFIQANLNWLNPTLTTQRTSWALSLIWCVPCCCHDKVQECVNSLWDQLCKLRLTAVSLERPVCARVHVYIMWSNVSLWVVRNLVTLTTIFLSLKWGKKIITVFWWIRIIECRACTCDGRLWLMHWHTTCACHMSLIYQQDLARCQYHIVTRNRMKVVSI